jgi:DNA helicase-2/ATP-dependent DNA helicase PcrA
VAENETQAADDAVNVMTLHAAKGLEFDTVYLPGWEEGLFPHQRAMDEGGAAALEEERRLAYVGLTRAKRLAVVSFAANRRVFDRWQAGLPSRFVAELPEADVEHRLETGLFAGGSLSPMHGEAAFDDGYSSGRFAPRRPRMRPAGPAGSQPSYLEGQAEAVVTSDPAAASFAVGERVFHAKFGYGRIEDISGNKLEIAFDKAGTKKVIDSFVEPA